MKRGTVSFLLCLALLCFSSCEAATVNATHQDGFETIHLESPSQLTEIHWVNSTSEGIESHYLVFGETTFKAITFGYPFQALDVNRKVGLPFISVALFHNASTGILYAVGPTYRDSSATLTTGYFLPLGFNSPTESISFQGDHRGFTFFSVHVDPRNETDVLVYFVGWGPNPNQLGSVSLVLVRSHLNMDGPLTTRGFYWNQTDIVTLYNDDYSPFSSTFKPHIFLEWWQNRLYVLDPASHTLFQIFVPNATRDPIYLLGNPFTLPTTGRISGVAYTAYFNMIYVGLATSGNTPGSLLSISLPNMRITNSFTFPQWYSNPIAITEFNETVYIGFAEGPNIVKFDAHDFQIRGYQRVPDYLRNSFKAFDAGHEHVYFITREQHSKVFRVAKTDFCTSSCPYDGYCTKGVCGCKPGYILSANKEFCEVRPGINSEKIVVERGAAVAMGILFALTVIVAAAGWFLWYKGKRSSYSHV